jgi:hypothetical protein
MNALAIHRITWLARDPRCPVEPMSSRDPVRACRAKGVRVYADALVSHMTGDGNDVSNQRNPDSGCITWPGKHSSAPNDEQSPDYAREGVQCVDGPQHIEHRVARGAD